MYVERRTLLKILTASAAVPTEALRAAATQCSASGVGSNFESYQFAILHAGRAGPCRPVDGTHHSGRCAFARRERCPRSRLCGHDDLDGLDTTKTAWRPACPIPRGFRGRPSRNGSCPGCSRRKCSEERRGTILYRPQAHDRRWLLHFDHRYSEGASIRRQYAYDIRAGL